MQVAKANMEAMKNRLVQKIQGSRLLRDLREFDALIKAIGECKSKVEEDRIITAEVEVLKARLADPKIDKTRGREYLVRLIYCEMLGHDTSWAYVKALQFASEPNILTKKAAYLALTQFFDQNHELVLLLVNTLLSDLKSDNFINVCTGLVVCTKLIGPDLINAVYPLVVDRLKHPKEHVRKKAVMVLHRFHQLDPKREGPLAGLELDKHFRTMLCDKDPGVMSATLCALHDVIKTNPGPYKNLIPSFTSILKQVSEHRLPKSYDYHRVPAPFIQIKLLKVLALLGAGDRAASENMYAVVQQALRRATPSHTIGNAIIFECVTCITTIFPNPHLITAAAEAVATFLKSPVHNLRYVGVDALAGIIRVHPQAAQDHQLAVVDCLEDPDDSLKLKTLELLYRMTKAANVEVIVERMLSYLRTVTDEHVKRDITRKVSELAERYAPSPAWFIRVVSEVCELAGDHVESGMAHALTRLIAEQDQELHRSAVEQYASLLDSPGGRHLPDVLMQVMVWTLGEYGSLLANSAGAKRLTPQQLQAKLVGLVTRQKCSDTVRQLLPPALAKLSVQGGVPFAPEAETWLTKAGASQSAELQQRAYEALALLTAPPAVQQAALPHDASCEEVDETETAQLKNLAFLDWYVDKASQSGAAPYAPPQHALSAVSALLDPHHKPSAAGGHALRFEAYDAAPPAPSQPTAASGAYPGSYGSGGGGGGPLDDFFGTPAAPSHTSAAPAAAPVPAGPSEPQLRAAANKQGARWGPAQFEAPPPASVSRGGAGSAAGAGPSKPAGRDLLDLDGGSGSAGRGTPKAAQASERDRLAASLFAGLSTAPGARSGASAAGTPGKPTPAAQPPARPAPAPAVDLLSLDDPVPAAPAYKPAPAAAVPGAGALDLLMDLTGPPLPAPAAPAVPGLGGLDSLLGLGGPVPSPAGMMGGAALQPPLGAAPAGGPVGWGQPAAYGVQGAMPGGLTGLGGLPSGGAKPQAGMGTMGVTTSGAFQGLASAQLTSMGRAGGVPMGAAASSPAPAPKPAPAAAAADPFADLI